MIDFSRTINALADTELRRWATALPEQVAQGMSHRRYGDLKHWLSALESLPDVSASEYSLYDRVRIGKNTDCSPDQYKALENALRALQPWRKGPYDLFGVHIDTEWRSDWKWDRLSPHLSPLKNRTILDIGCGNGYHCWRMLGANAQRVIGIDPSPRFVVQFHMLKKYLPQAPIDVLPTRIEDLPANLNAFDTVFSMGVLYHRPSPMDHLLQLRDALKVGGELVLETLVIEGDCGQSLVPEGRYAKMNNVWFIPSVPTLTSWMKKCGFDNVRCVNTSQTSMKEQRKTSWMTNQSLEDFLNPNNLNLTVEGHPAPARGIVIANRMR